MRGIASFVVVEGDARSFWGAEAACLMTFLAEQAKRKRRAKVPAFIPAARDGSLLAIERAELKCDCPRF